MPQEYQKALLHWDFGFELLNSGEQFSAILSLLLFI